MKAITAYEAVIFFLERRKEEIAYFILGSFFVGPMIVFILTFDPSKNEAPKKTDLQRPVYEFVINDDETVLF